MIRNVIAILALLIWSTVMYAQVSITASFDQDTIMIGDEAQLTISVKYSGPIQVIEARTTLDSIISGTKTQRHQEVNQLEEPVYQIGDFDILDYGHWQDKDHDGVFSGEEIAWDTTYAGANNVLENTIKVQLWDAGQIIGFISGFSFLAGQDTIIGEGRAVAQIMTIPPFDLDLLTEENQDSLDIAPIKNIILEPKNISDYYGWFYALGSILAALLAYFLYKKIQHRKLAKEQAQEEEKIIIPPHLIAIEKLEKLQQDKPWLTGQIKAYQSDLTYIIREYLEGRYDIQALESTTDEIIKKLQTKDFDDHDEKVLKEILQVADLVKFAKAKPSEDIHERFLHQSVDFVEKTKRIPEEITSVEALVIVEEKNAEEEE